MIFWIDVAVRLAGFGSCWYLLAYVACGGSPYRRVTRKVNRWLR